MIRSDRGTLTVPTYLIRAPEQVFQLGSPHPSPSQGDLLGDGMNGTREAGTFLPSRYRGVAETTAARLLDEGLGQCALTLSSNHPLAAAMAHAIGTELGCPVRQVEDLYVYGNWPSNLQTSLDQLLSPNLDTSTSGLVVVTHTDLVLAALGLDRDHIGYVPVGEPFLYEPGSWINPFERADQLVGLARAGFSPA